MEVEQAEQHCFDGRFEFDAPRFYDFEAMSGGTPADKWFDTAPEGPGCKPERPGGNNNRQPFTELQDNAGNTQQDAPVAKAGVGAKGGAAAAEGRKTAPAEGGKTAAAGAAATGAEAEPPAGTVNIVTSWGGGRKSAAPPAAAAAAPPAAAAAAAGAPAGTSAAGQSKPGVRRLSKEARRVCSTSTGGGEGQDAAAAAARSEPPVTRSMSRLGLQLFSPVPEHKTKYGSPPATRARAAVQRFYTVQKGKSTTAHTTKQPTSMQKLHNVLAPKVTKPTRSTKPLTLPDDFELQTTRRCQGRPASAAAAVGAAEEKSPFKPLAEKVRDFQYKTPQRFKSRASKAATSKKRSPITRGEAPQLMTSLRSRPRMKSQQEIEQEQVEAMRREQFKAKPVNSRVLSSSGQLGVPKVEKVRVTEPRPFNLRSDSRAKVRRSHEQPSMQAAAAAAASGGGGGGGKFKAQPLNRSILDGPTFMPTHRERPEVTKAVSPELMTKKRALGAGTVERQHNRPASARSHAEQQLHSSHGEGSLNLTQPQPFRLATEARGAQHQHEMAAKVAEEEARAKRMRRVTARPLPVTVDVPVAPPKPDSRPLTLPDPFELRSQARHEEYEQHHRQQLQQEEEAARHAAEFKARPIATAGPFVVHESEAPLTVPVDPDFATDMRAPRRAEFDSHMAERVQREEEERRRQAELKRKQEEEAVREYRKKLRFSARPMPNFSEGGFYAQPSSKPLTKPRTPNFASKRLSVRRGGG